MFLPDRAEKCKDGLIKTRILTCASQACQVFNDINYCVMQRLEKEMLMKICKNCFYSFFLFLLWGCASHDSSLSFSSEIESFPQPVSTEELTVPEPEITTAEEIRGLEKLGDWEKNSIETLPAQTAVQYDFPVIINKQVEYYLDFFTNKHRNSFHCWLERSGRYVPMIQEHLRQAGLPLDLAYLPMIESGYTLTAYSKAKAAGPWQFISSTGRHYGLAINRYIDERRDPEKATLAAIAFLSELYERFHSWELSVAAYNAGPGKIGNGLKKYKTDDFWELASKRYLKLETKRYVPKLMAAIIISRDPEKYGFTDIQYEQPLEYDSVDVPRWTSLEAVTVACAADLKQLRTLNSQLRKNITPPDQAYYSLKVPAGMKSTVEENLPNVHATVTTSYKTHIVKSRDSLTRICRSYKINKTTLLKVNNLRTAKLTPGQRLRIPYQTTNYVLLDKNIMPGATLAGNNLVLHTIRPGESISGIAKQYHVPPRMIASWNGLKNLHHIRAGQQLALYIQDSNSKPPVITARTTKKQIGRMASATHSQPVYYQVRQGDSLWSIARRNQLSPQQIRHWNNLQTNLIHPGARLLLQAPAS